MSWTTILLIILGLALLLIAFLWVRTARRLDRLHRSVLQYRVTLSDALARRSRAALDVAQSGALDPAASVLLGEAALEAVSVSGDPLVDDGLEGTCRHGSEHRLLLESSLSRCLRAVLGEIDTDNEQWAELEQRRTNVRIARRFHNLRVDQARRLRQKAWVSRMKMAGRAPMPRPVDMDDE